VVIKGDTVSVTELLVGLVLTGPVSVVEVKVGAALAVVVIVIVVSEELLGGMYCPDTIPATIRRPARYRDMVGVAIGASNEWIVKNETVDSKKI
jgi:hypothetical protein